jgi:glycosyltransferase involved in cell wall biosynthesis
MYELADAFVLPSVSEGLPNVLLEAAAMEVPIVANGINGIFDIIEHGKSGLLVSDQKASTYAQYLKMILSDSSLAMRLSLNAREHVKSRFTWDKIIPRYLDLYNKCIH